MNPPSPEPEDLVPKAGWDEKECKALFDKYRDVERLADGEDVITYDGLERLCKDLSKKTWGK